MTNQSKNVLVGISVVILCVIAFLLYGILRVQKASLQGQLTIAAVDCLRVEGQGEIAVPTTARDNCWNKVQDLREEFGWEAGE